MTPNIGPELILVQHVQCSFFVNPMCFLCSEWLLQSFCWAVWPIRKMTYSIGLTYGAGLLSGGFYGGLLGVRQGGATPKLFLNSVLNSCSRYGPALANQSAIITMYYVPWFDTRISWWCCWKKNVLLEDRVCFERSVNMCQDFKSGIRMVMEYCLRYPLTSCCVRINPSSSRMNQYMWPAAIWAASHYGPTDSIPLLY